MEQKRWHTAQAKEFEWQRNSDVRKDRIDWQNQSIRLFEGLGVDCGMKGKTILDLGCGPTLRTMVFSGENEVVGLDPLIKDYSTLPFSDVLDVEHYAVPAEDYVPALKRRFDIVFCLNVLDHCYNPRLVIRRAGQYLKQAGQLYLWTDIGHHDAMHEGQMSVAEIVKWVSEAGLSVIRLTEGVDPLNFSKTDAPDYQRCGEDCGPAVSCIVVKAISDGEPVDDRNGLPPPSLSDRLDIVESRLNSLASRLQHLDKRQRQYYPYLDLLVRISNQVARILPTKVVTFLKRRP